MNSIRLNTRTILLSTLCIALFLSVPAMLIATTNQDASANQHEEPAIADGADAGFVHVVFFWIEEDASEADKQQLIDDCRELLGAIESVTNIEVGVPAGTPREVVDNSYGVALIVHFKDKAGHDHYQKAQKHLDFIERNQNTWSKVQVYDFIPS